MEFEKNTLLCSLFADPVTNDMNTNGMKYKTPLE